MKVARTVAALLELLGRERAGGRSIGFVPTMGALHRGHISLIEAARAHDDVVVLSIFVNPLQFGEGEDLEAYPRPEATDLEAAEAAGVDIAFLPSAEEMYPATRATTVHVGSLSEVVEGAARPGHFDGVATVVAKLLNIVQPHRAYFGEKDAQQVAVIRQMTRDLSIPVDVVVCATVREPDGLALSSRNAYLEEEDRRRATVLWRALKAGESALRSGDQIDVVEKTMRALIESEPGVELEYARAVDPDSFGPPAGDEVLLVVAARVGRARLIDNLLVSR